MLLLLRRALLASGVLAALPAAATAAPLAADSTVLIGAAAPGSLTPLPSPAEPSDVGPGGVSSDGRYVAFASHADGLSTENDDDTTGIYVKDRLTGTVEFVSRRTGVAGAANTSGCDAPSISADGKRVAFECYSSLSPLDTNDDTDVYVRDLTTHATTLISIGASGAGNGSSNSAMISGNGNYVAFASYATNLVSGTPPNNFHVFRRLVGGAGPADLVDKPPAGVSAANGGARAPSISADGSRIAFVSSATNLVAGLTDANTYPDVYWRVMSDASVTGLVSSITGNSQMAGNGGADEPAMSGNGSYVAYSTNSSNVGDGDGDNQEDVHRRALGTSAVTLVSRATGPAGVKANAYAYQPRIDTTGDAVLFVSNAANLAGSGKPTQSFLRRIASGVTEQVSRASGLGGAAGVAGVSSHAISGNGLVAAFDGLRVTPDADRLMTAVYARDLGNANRPTTLVSRPPGTAPFVNTGESADIAGPGSLSADGRYTVYVSSAAGLPGATGDGVDLIWRRDVLTGDVVLVSRANGATGVAADGDAAEASISADGSRVVFMSNATNLGPGASGLGNGAYVRDIAAGTTTVVSRANGANGQVAETISSPTISGDGNRVAFTSNSKALGSNGSDPNLFVRDLTTETTVRVAPQQPGRFSQPMLDADGSRVSFVVTTSAPGKESSNLAHPYWAEVQGGAAVRVDAGVADDVDGGNTSISADGNRIAFSTHAHLTAGDTDATTDVFVKDLTSGVYTLVSATADGKPATGGSYLSQISADGRKVAFSSDAKNLVTTPVGDRTNAFVRDLAAGTTAYASRADGAAGATLDANVLGFAVSADGGCVAFETTATTLGVGLTKAQTRVWLRSVSGSCPAPSTPAPESTPTPTPTPTPGPGTPPNDGGPKPAAPKLSAVKASRKAFVTKGKKAGTTISFVLDQAARVDAVVARSTKGHKSGKKCKTGAPKKRLKQKACTILKPATTLQAQAKAGTGSLVFSGKVKRKRLAKGSYVVTLTASGPGGKSAPVVLKLTIR